MSLRERIVQTLMVVEGSNDPFMVDRCAFTLALAHRAELEDGNRLVAKFPKLKAQFDDCIKQDAKPILKARALLMLSNNREREDHIGRISDLIIRRNV